MCLVLRSLLYSLVAQTCCPYSFVTGFFFSTGVFLFLLLAPASVDKVYVCDNQHSGFGDVIVANAVASSVVLGLLINDLF